MRTHSHKLAKKEHSSQNRKFCALISPVFHIRAQFNSILVGAPADVIAGNELYFLPF